MAVLSEHRTKITLDLDPPMQLEVNTQQLTMDLEWVPFIQATLSCALGDGAIADVDPLADDIWATLTVRKLLGRVDRLGDLTRKYRGKTLGDVTADFAGGTLTDVTLAVYHDYTEPGHPMRSQDRDFRLMLRDQTVDRKAGTVALSLASGEARLFDDAWTAAEYTIPGATIRDCLEWVLARSGFTLTTVAGEAPVLPSWVLGDTRIWQPGQTAWEVLQQMARSRNYLMYCDEDGHFHANYSRGTPYTRTLRSAGASRSVVNAVEKRSRDDGWYTAVQVVFTRAGVTTRGFATTPGEPVKIYTRTYPAEWGAPSDPDALAENIRQQIVGRARSLELLAVSDYALTPGDGAVFISPRGSLAGKCSAVQWNWPADEMSVRMREVA
ncbi:hypothetical protein [Microbacterium allomyrinae]|uniref:Phage tail protein n=1 Tax=Microbacterium allomyrinae TaxID=2830666 RepID=A0A9X1LUS3_9MICO|nr:hypothetical protein [Microbacterium allomyrinae]MCC2032449.1 hypothetical protein [Microbacterium allomyrinae]